MKLEDCKVGCKVKTRKTEGNMSGVIRQVYPNTRYPVRVEIQVEGAKPFDVWFEPWELELVEAK